MGRLLVEDYLREIERLRRFSGSAIESVVSEAFKDLLKAWSRFAGCAPARIHHAHEDPHPAETPHPSRPASCSALCEPMSTLHLGRARRCRVPSQRAENGHSLRTQ
jgi:hypothetical protein